MNTRKDMMCFWRNERTAKNAQVRQNPWLQGMWLSWEYQPWKTGNVDPSVLSVHNENSDNIWSFCIY